jgi:hypothetical protein
MPAQASWVPPQATYAQPVVPAEYVQPTEFSMALPQQNLAVQPQYVQQAVIAQPVAAAAQPTMAFEYAQPPVAVAQPSVAYSSNLVESLNQAINVGEVRKPGRASEFYEMYKSMCQNSGVCASTFGAAQVVSAGSTAIAPSTQATMASVVETVLPQQQAVTYAQPPAAVMVEQLPINSFIPAPGYSHEKMQTQSYSYIPQTDAVQMTVAAPAAAMVMAAPNMAPVLAQGPESVVLDEVGEWMVCEDAQGLFYYHSPTAQSHDQPPLELVQYYDSIGVQLVPTGAFGAQMAQAPMVMQQAPIMAAPAYQHVVPVY